MNLDSLPRTADEAQRAGLKHYYPGRLCKHGHTSPRYSRGAQGCVQCTVEKNRATDIARKAERWSVPAMRPLALLGADWSLRVVEGSLDDLLALALKEQNKNAEHNHD